MGVFEDVVINARSAAETVGKEAGRWVDISRLRFSAAEIQKEISKRLENLGRMVYDSRKSGSPVDISFDGQIESIDALYKRLDEVNEKINILRKKTVCLKCGFDNAEDSVFCSRCGTKLGAEQNDQSPAPDASGVDGSNAGDNSI